MGGKTFKSQIAGTPNIKMSQGTGPQITKVKYFFQDQLAESSQEQLTSAHRHPFLLADIHPDVSSLLRCYCLFSSGAKMCHLFARLELAKPSLPINTSTKDRVQPTSTCQVNAYGAWSRMLAHRRQSLDCGVQCMLLSLWLIFCHYYNNSYC